MVSKLVVDRIEPSVAGQAVELGAAIEFSDGTRFNTATLPAGGNGAFAKYNAGSASFLIPAGTAGMMLTLTGGGGGAGASNSVQNWSYGKTGPGGGGGGASKAYFPLNNNVDVTANIVVGAGGTGGKSGNVAGNAGGSTSINISGVGSVVGGGGGGGLGQSGNTVRNTGTSGTFSSNIAGYSGITASGVAYNSVPSDRRGGRKGGDPVGGFLAEGQGGKAHPPNTASNSSNFNVTSYPGTLGGGASDAGCNTNSSSYGADGGGGFIIVQLLD